MTDAEKANVKWWESTFPDEPFDPNVWGGVKGFGLLIEAIKLADSLDPDKIVEAYETNEFEVLGWKVHFGSTPDTYQGRPRVLIQPVYFMTIEGGQVKVFETILPEGVERL